MCDDDYNKYALIYVIYGGGGVGKGGTCMCDDDYNKYALILFGDLSELRTVEFQSSKFHSSSNSIWNSNVLFIFSMKRCSNHIHKLCKQSCLLTSVVS